jgi:DNA mismatch repair ATPase MutS
MESRKSFPIWTCFIGLGSDGLQCRIYNLPLYSLNPGLSFGAVSRQKNWHMPVFGDTFSMNECRNPIIGLMGNEAVSNSAVIAEDKVGMLITGPNMAGKSTFLSTIGVCQVSTLFYAVILHF